MWPPAVPRRAACPLSFPFPLLRSPAVPTVSAHREIFRIAGHRNKTAIAPTSRDGTRACPSEFSLNHELVWLMIGYFRDPADYGSRRTRSSVASEQDDID